MIRRTMTAGGLVIGLMTAIASPASAHTIGLRYGANEGAVVRHNVVTALDKECDGRSVYLEYDVSTIGGTVRYRLYDSNGCNNSGSTRDHYPQQVTVARLCETDTVLRCSAWQYTCSPGVR